MYLCNCTILIEVYCLSAFAIYVSNIQKSTTYEHKLKKKKKQKELTELFRNTFIWQNGIIVDFLLITFIIHYIWNVWWCDEMISLKWLISLYRKMTTFNLTNITHQHLLSRKEFICTNITHGNRLNQSYIANLANWSSNREICAT